MSDDALTCKTVTLTHPYTRSDNVKAIQIALKGNGYDFGPIDGIYGPLTAGAVEMFKRYKGVTPVNPVVDLAMYYFLGVRCVSTVQLTEQLDYNNPLRQVVETAWYNNRKYWAFGPNVPLPVDTAQTKIAQEYMIAYSASPHGEPDLVPLQLNIYDSIPGMPQYGPIWHLNYVIVPRGYVPNTIRSAEQAVTSGYQIISSDRYVN